MSAPAPTPASASALPPGITDPNYSPPPGRLGNLTVPQQHALDTIRKELQDEEAFVPERMDDAALLRLVPTSHSSPSRNTLTPFHPFLLSPSNDPKLPLFFFFLGGGSLCIGSCARASSTCPKPRRCSCRPRGGEKNISSTSSCSTCCRVNLALCLLTA